MNGHISGLMRLDEETNNELLQCYEGERTGWYYYGPKKYLVTSVFKDKANEYFNLKTRSDDILIVTFPRSGTTLTQELVWLLTHKFDYETAKRLNLWTRSPFLEFNMLIHPETKKEILNKNKGNITNEKIINEMFEPAYLKINEMPSPRVIKTHLPISMLPTDIKDTKPKIIYVARNVKDVSLSFYHLVRLWKTSDFVGTFEQFISQFQKGLVVWGPYWEHIQEGWENRNNENCLFLFYEDMIKNMKVTIHKLATFLSINISDDEVDILADHVNIKNFKNNPAVNFEGLREVGILNQGEESFIRQGLSRGDGKEFTEEHLIKFNKWVDENSKRINIKFPAKQQ